MFYVVIFFIFFVFLWIFSAAAMTVGILRRVVWRSDVTNGFDGRGAQTNLNKGSCRILLPTISHILDCFKVSFICAVVTFLLNACLHECSTGGGKKKPRTFAQWRWNEFLSPLYDAITCVRTYEQNGEIAREIWQLVFLCTVKVRKHVRRWADIAVSSAPFGK